MAAALCPTVPLTTGRGAHLTPRPRIPLRLFTGGGVATNRRDVPRLFSPTPFRHGACVEPSFEVRGGRVTTLRVRGPLLPGVVPKLCALLASHGGGEPGAIFSMDALRHPVTASFTSEELLGFLGKGGGWGPLPGVVAVREEDGSCVWRVG